MPMSHSEPPASAGFHCGVQRVVAEAEARLHRPQLTDGALAQQAARQLVGRQEARPQRFHQEHAPRQLHQRLALGVGRDERLLAQHRLAGRSAARTYSPWWECGVAM
jgi:hypothetical protein